MKRLPILVLVGIFWLSLFGSNYNSIVRAQTANKTLLRVDVDLRVELFAIIFRLAGNREYNQGKLQNYISDIDDHFAPFREHQAIRHARQLREKMGVGYDVVMFRAIHMNDPYELKERVAFDAPGGIPEQKGIPKPQARQFAAEIRSFLEDVRRFTVDAKVREFFDAHQKFYDAATQSLRLVVNKNVDANWLDRFYGKSPNADFIIVPLLANSETNFGPRLPDVEGGIKPEIYAILTTNKTDAKGMPVFDKGKVETLVHEFSHSYVNPLVLANGKDFESSGKIIYKQVEDAMIDQGDGDWQIMMFESIVRAAVIRYLLTHESKKAVESEIAAQRGKGFLIMPELVKLLGEYEASRKKYPTLESFMPRVIELFKDFSTRVVSVKSAYDGQRPKASSVSIKDGETVDPNLTEIVINFDQPMLKTKPTAPYDIHAAPRGSKAVFPTVTGQEFSKNGMSFRLRIKLELEQDYELILNRPSGGAFVNTKMIPFLPLTIRFNTRKLE